MQGNTSLSILKVKHSSRQAELINPKQSIRIQCFRSGIWRLLFANSMTILAVLCYSIIYYTEHRGTNDLVDFADTAAKKCTETHIQKCERLHPKFCMLKSIKVCLKMEHSFTEYTVDKK